MVPFCCAFFFWICIFHLIGIFLVVPSKSFRQEDIQNSLCMGLFLEFRRLQGEEPWEMNSPAKCKKNVSVLVV